MADVVVDLEETLPGSGTEPVGEPPRRRGRKVLTVVLAALAVVLLAGVAWFVFGRDQAREIDTTEALDEFRAANVGSGEGDGRPTAGVYPATVTGVESIGLPGFDEELGPNAPVTVTHGEAGCFTYRADFNSHHWRSWTFCPSASATFALVASDSWTERSAPGLEIASLATVECQSPADVLWAGAAVGDTRSGACTSSNDVDEGVADDAVRVDVLGTDTLTVGDREVDVVHVRTTETFSGSLTGTEVDEWWLDAATSLPLRLVIDARLLGGQSDYTETADLQLTSLTPAT
jgi:hypothetical protein